MTSSGTSCEVEFEHAHLVMSRDRRPMTVLVKDGLVIEAVLNGQVLELALYNIINGYQFTSLTMPWAAFDEMLEMVIGFGK